MKSQIIFGSALVMLGALMMVTITIIDFMALFIWGVIFFIIGLLLLIFKDKESEIEQIKKKHKGGKKK